MTEQTQTQTTDQSVQTLTLAQKMNLLDPGSATKFSADAIATPHVYVENFAQAVRNEVLFEHQADAEHAVEQAETLTGAVAIEKRLHHIVKEALAQHLSITVTPNADPSLPPVVIAVVPFTPTAKPAA